MNSKGRISLLTIAADYLKKLKGERTYSGSMNLAIQGVVTAMCPVLPRPKRNQRIKHTGRHQRIKIEFRPKI